ncbi:MAG TPA: hypothetical protein PK668_07025 [Myxococcota bacterium]|nr:hypothetical protein [Myxococcota bacterium]HRY92403.1 hypothetical protein [Myxococcota bacterium]HSA22873.1 hypothetical protein [Myxococcota bacterium]
MRLHMLLALWWLGLAATALAGESLLPGQLVETIDADTALVQCRGEGESTEAAVLHARLGCLRWYAEGLTSTPAEEAALEKLWPSLERELDKLVGLVQAGSRDGRGEGLRSRRSLGGDRVQVVLNTRLHASALKRRMQEAGARAAPPAGGTGRSVVVIPAPGAPRPRLWFLVKAELIPFLQKAGFEVLEEPEPGQAPGAELVLRVGVKRLHEPDAQASSYAVALELVEVRTKRVVASGAAQGMRRPAGSEAEESRGLREAVVDAAGKIQPLLEALGQGAGAK